MNVLHLRSQYVVDGGVETFLGALIKELGGGDAQHHVAVLTTENIRRETFGERLAGECGIESLRLPWDKRRMLVTTLNDLVGIIKSRGIDIVHTHDNRANLLGLALRGIPGRRVAWLASAHGWVDRPFKSRIIGDIDKVVVRFADRVHFAHASLFRQVRRVPEARLVSIPYFIDGSGLLAGSDDAGTGMRRIWGIPDGCTLLGMVGRLGEEKGHTYLLKAMRLIADRYPETRLVVVGDGPLRGALQEESSRLGLDDRVVFAGFCESAIRACSAFDIFVHSSLSETQSIVIGEAMGLGKPIVATTVGTNAEVVTPGINGYLVPPADAEALADAVCRLLADPARCREFATAGRREYERTFSPAAIAARYRTLYGEMLNCAHRN